MPKKRCVKRDRDIGRKAVLSDVKAAFARTPALIFPVIWFECKDREGK